MNLILWVLPPICKNKFHKVLLFVAIRWNEFQKMLQDYHLQNEILQNFLKTFKVF